MHVRIEDVQADRQYTDRRSAMLCHAGRTSRGHVPFTKTTCVKAGAVQWFRGLEFLMTTRHVDVNVYAVAKDP